MPWPSWVGPTVTAAVAVGAATLTWSMVDTVVSVRHRPGVLVRRPLVAVGIAGVAAGVLAGARAVLLPRLEQTGREHDAGLAAPPVSELVSGGRDSTVSYASLGREGARFVQTVTTAQDISAVLGAPALAEPIRIFVGVESGSSPEQRVDLAIAEMRRTGAFERSTIVVQSPAGSGYANPTPVQVVEIATAGDCASVAVGYGLLPSFLSLDRVERATHTQRLLLQAIFTELSARDVDDRPRILLYGESLGARVQQRAITPAELVQRNIHAALWVGTPGGRDSDRFRALLTEPAVVVDRPEQLPRPLPQPHPRVWFLEHDGDPVVRFRRDLLHRHPEWLRQHPRGRLVPDEMHWMPVITWIQVLVDTLFATHVTAGEFDSAGHDYRGDLGAVVCAAFDFHLPPEAMIRLEAGLRRLEVERAKKFAGADTRP
jgi:uncharacterized membrane protein